MEKPAELLLTNFKIKYLGWICCPCQLSARPVICKEIFGVLKGSVREGKNHVFYSFARDCIVFDCLHYLRYISGI